MSKLEFEAVYIKWLDHGSHTTSEWRDLEEAAELKPIVCHTMGFVLYETDEIVVVGQTFHAHEEYDPKYASDMMIIKKLILERQTIKL